MAHSVQDCRYSRACQEDGVCDWDPEDLECDEGERNSVPLMAVGIAAMGLGAAGGLTTLVFWMAAGFAGADSGDPLIVGLGLSSLGLVVAGAVMTPIGAIKVDRGPLTPDVAIGPGSMHLSWSF